METNKLLEVGTKAPDFMLLDAEGNSVFLADFAGKKLYGKVSMSVVRSTFVIYENGVIEKVMPKAKPDTNAAEILAYLNGDK